MTLKAHALGMNSTHFANASGLPNGEQVTTARDFAILGRAVQERFPRHYHYFAREPQSSPRSRRGDGRNQDRLHPRLRLQSSDLGKTRRTLYRRRSTATPSAIRASAVAARSPEADKIAAAIKEPPQGGVVKSADVSRPAVARSGWMIQIGATGDMGKATELLARAKSQGRKTLTTAQALTEKVQKGSETLYRARFAGLEADSAALACKTLKRSGFSCFATKN
jgi:D-alanyl-D-alanine carboxypeptidase